MSNFHKFILFHFSAFSAKWKHSDVQEHLFGPEYSSDNSGDGPQLMLSVRSPIYNKHSQISIIDGPDNQFISTDNSSSNGDTAFIPQPTVSVDIKKTKVRKSETNELPPVYFDMDNVVAESGTLESTDSDSNSSEFGDGIPN